MKVAAQGGRGGGGLTDSGPIAGALEAASEEVERVCVSPPQILTKTDTHGSSFRPGSRALDLKAKWQRRRSAWPVIRSKWHRCRGCRTHPGTGPGGRHSSLAAQPKLWTARSNGQLGINLFVFHYLIIMAL
ncbi:hypothetical protein DPEC_G00031440 [Dallia pectoralis]|uniref:Uncharacterized protein n=1 Tax=Dallia pectoralis TaxID=75939 RepID=A0ACC2HC85_DALPE|nr:hypothetical protein DPEC_G00031440 [Dallia pectoralis]